MLTADCLNWCYATVAFTDTSRAVMHLIALLGLSNYSKVITSVVIVSISVFTPISLASVAIMATITRSTMANLETTTTILTSAALLNLNEDYCYWALLRNFWSVTIPISVGSFWSVAVLVVHFVCMEVVNDMDDIGIVGFYVSRKKVELVSTTVEISFR